MDSVQPNLAKALTNRMNYLSQRQGVLSSNIANVNTPDFKAKDITFAQALSEAQLKPSMTNGKHMATDSSSVSTGKLTESDLNPKNNGNTVRIDEQLIKMNEAQLQFNLVTSLFSKHASMQRIALGAGAAQ